MLCMFDKGRFNRSLIWSWRTTAIKLCAQRQANERIKDLNLVSAYAADANSGAAEVNLLCSYEVYSSIFQFMLIDLVLEKRTPFLVAGRFGSIACRSRSPQ